MVVRFALLALLFLASCRGAPSKAVRPGPASSGGLTSCPPTTLQPSQPSPRERPTAPDVGPVPQPESSDDECPGGVCRVPRPFADSLPEGEIVVPSTARVVDPVTPRGPTHAMPRSPVAAALSDDSLPDWCRLAGLLALGAVLLVCLCILIARLTRRPSA